MRSRYNKYILGKYVILTSPCFIKSGNEYFLGVDNYKTINLDTDQNTLV